jgi:hypothetical protein
LESKTAAQTAAQTATSKASEATTAAQTATTKASEAFTNASTATSAKDTAVSASQTATSKASEAAQSATSANTAKVDAVAAKTAAETAQGKAEDAQAAAEAVAESIPSDYSQLSEDVTELKSELNGVIEVKSPINYGAMITAEDCLVTGHPEAATIYDSENGIVINKTGRFNIGVQFFFNDLPIASAASPVTYDFSIAFDDTTGIDAVYFYDSSTQVGSLSGGTITQDGNTYKFSYTYPNQSKLRWQIGLLYSFQSTKTITNIGGIASGATDVYKIIPDTIDWYLKERDGLDFDAPRNALKVNKHYSSSLWTQGACTIGNSYLGFNASPDDHLTNGTARIASFDDPTNYTRINHNLGHCASAD